MGVWELTHFQLPPTKNFLGAIGSRGEVRRSCRDGGSGLVALVSVCAEARDGRFG